MEIVRCPKCTVCYLNPAPSDTTLEELHRSDFAGNLDSFVAKMRKYFDAPGSVAQYTLTTLRAFGLAGKKVVELGCGLGLLSEALKKEGAEVLSVDSNPKAALAAKTHCNVDVIVDTVEGICSRRIIPTASCDYVVSMECLEHVRNPYTFVKAGVELLKPGGLLILTTPDFGEFKTLGKKAVAINQFFERLIYFEKNSLGTLLLRVGMQQIEVRELFAMTPSYVIKRLVFRSPFLNSLWQAARRIGPLKKLVNAILVFLDNRRKKRLAYEGNISVISMPESQGSSPPVLFALARRPSR